MPLKWAIQCIAYLDFVDSTFDGAEFCPLANTPGCIYSLDKGGYPLLPGWTCGASTSPFNCYGRSGTQALQSLGRNFDAIKSDNVVGTDFGIVIAIGMFFQFNYMFLAARKCGMTSKIVDKETSLSTPGPSLIELNSYGEETA